MSSKSQRYLALDVLRGITIAGMITVNTPGSWAHIYAPLKHSAWHGCTPTDLVFPFFLFVMGVSMFFSFSKYNNSLNKASLLKVGKRSLLIFGIGLFLNSFPQWMCDFSSLRILGVLQRIAICYLFASLIVLAARPNYVPIIGALILLLYWGLLGMLGGADPFSLEHNATIAIDRFFLGESHMYHGFGISFDPEGLLSTIPAIVTVLIGYLVGYLIKNTAKEKVPVKLIAFGAAGIVVGWLWGLVFPINKPLWTSSYVVYTAGLGTVLLAILVWIIDIKGYKKWTSFFVVFGMNPLFIFALSVFWVKSLFRFIHITGADGKVLNGYSGLYQTVFVPLAGELNGSLLFALSHIAMYWFIGWLLYKNRIFIKV